VSRDQRSTPNVTSIRLADAREHLARAEEHLRSAKSALERGDLNTAGSNAVTAGMPRL
jgi:hypothetical protein